MAAPCLRLVTQKLLARAPASKKGASAHKHLPEGGECRMDKDATIVRVGPGATCRTTRVRYAAAQLSAGGCLHDRV